MMKQLFLCLSVLIIAGGTVARDPSGNQFKGDELQSITVPVGGIGSGNILMGGRGNIEYVEVFNRPDRQRKLEKTFFSLWVREEGKEPVTTLLERELLPPFNDVTHSYAWGLPRMDEVTMTNNYPRLSWQFNDESVPLNITLEILNPVVPLDLEFSSFPVVKFNWIITNPTNSIIGASIALSVENPVQAGMIANRFLEQENLKGIHFTPEGDEVPVNFQGSMFYGTTAGNTDIQTSWYPGTWRDETHIFWNDFMDDGRIDNKKDDWLTNYKPASYNESTKRMSTVLVPLTLQPGEEITVPFYMAWYFPERVFTSAEVFGIKEAEGIKFKNHYTGRFSGAVDALQQYLSQEALIEKKAGEFARILNNSTYPEYVREALNTQVSTLISPLVQITAEGEVHGFEGVLDNGWCCPGTCTHVWNYEQTLASLFPSLERKMREIEFMHNTFEDGFQVMRSVIPLGQYWFNGPAAADGQMGTIVRAYREWKLSGDNDWLAMLWPQIKKALEFAWSGSGEPAKAKTGNVQQAWDPQKTGLLSGRQHNTYDIDFYGPNSLTSSIYLAALKAGSEMALAMGEKDKSEEYRAVFEKGSQLFIDSLWNGEYFIQIIPDDTELYREEQLSPPDRHGKRLPKYQYDNGCLADQLLGQYLAFVSGMGYIADSGKVDKAFESIYKYNFMESLREFANVQRVYGLNDEAGLVLCSWPYNDRPLLPFVYADEIWTGVEYQVAASLIYAGKTEEGLRIVKAVQDRYNGKKRNPFAHIESGVHYARAMSSWSLLLALSGVQYDGVKKELAFAPKILQDDFRSFWSTGSAWGEIMINKKEATLNVVHGKLNLKMFSVQNPYNSEVIIRNYDREKEITEGERLMVSFL